MAQAKYVLKFTNDLTPPTNYQLVDVDVLAPSGTVAQNLAQILCYFSTIGFTVMGGTTRLVEANYRLQGSAGATSLPFPTTEFAAVLAAATTDGISPGGMATGFASQISGAGNLSPLGTSISVSEITATVGRTGRGRHFLPFVGVNNLTTGGQVSTSVINRIREAWIYFLTGLIPSSLTPATAPVVNLDPIVTNATGSPTRLITLVRPQPIYSNLETRRR